MLLLLKILVVFLNASGCLQLDAGAFVVLELSPYFQFSNVTVGHALSPFRYHKNNYHWKVIGRQWTAIQSGVQRWTFKILHNTWLFVRTYCVGFNFMHLLFRRFEEWQTCRCWSLNRLIPNSTSGFDRTHWKALHEEKEVFLISRNLEGITSQEAWDQGYCFSARFCRIPWRQWLQQSYVWKMPPWWMHCKVRFVLLISNITV